MNVKRYYQFEKKLADTIDIVLSMKQQYILMSVSFLGLILVANNMCINFLFLCLKFYIMRCKFQEVDLNFQAFRSFVKVKQKLQDSRKK